MGVAKIQKIARSQASFSYIYAYIYLKKTLKYISKAVIKCYMGPMHKVGTKDKEVWS